MDACHRPLVVLAQVLRLHTTDHEVRDLEDRDLGRRNLAYRFRPWDRVVGAGLRIRRQSLAWDLALVSAVVQAGLGMDKAELADLCLHAEDHDEVVRIVFLVVLVVVMIVLLASPRSRVCEDLVLAFGLR